MLDNQECIGEGIVKFPSVKKTFGRVAAAQRISRKTVRFVGAALLAAGVVTSNAPVSQADTGPSAQQFARAGGVFVIPAAPSVTLSDGTTRVAGHVSHSSHVSHGSHCSGYSYC
jgi:hypothetical protein